MYGAQAIAAAFVDSLKEYPPHQKPQSFNLDRIIEQLHQPTND
jgi:arylsulfatase